MSSTSAIKDEQAKQMTDKEENLETELEPFWFHACIPLLWAQFLLWNCEMSFNSRKYYWSQILTEFSIRVAREMKFQS
jgi:hypothetical protein